MSRFRNLESRHWQSHGYLVLPPIGDQSKVARARSLVNTTLCEVYPHGWPASKEEALPWVQAKSRIQSHPDIVGLVDDDLIATLEAILGSAIVPVKASQIACRFPGEGVDNIHIDNFTPKDFERRRLPSEFRILAGVVLEDNLEPDAGNFTCFPGSHNQIRAWLGDRYGEKTYDYLCQGTTALFAALKLPRPHQICAGKGSVILADRMLAHLICSPNNSPNVRKIVWFRIKTVDQDYAHLFRQPHDTPELIALEILGKCYLDQTANPLTIFAKPNILHHTPNMFASMVKITGEYMDSRFALASVHSSGFLSAESHTIWCEQLATLGTLSEIVEEINRTDYGELLRSWFVAPEGEGRHVDAMLTFHHLHSLSKSRMMAEWADIFGIRVEIARGTPGSITMVGHLNSILAYRDQGILRLHWSKPPVFTVE